MLFATLSFNIFAYLTKDKTGFFLSLFLIPLTIIMTYELSRENIRDSIGSGESKIIPVYTIEEGDTTNVSYKLIDNE